MTYSFQSAALSPIAFDPKTRYMKKTLKLYQVEVEGFNGEITVLEIEAHNDEEAAEKAQSYVDFTIYNANVYLL